MSGGGGGECGWDEEWESEGGSPYNGVIMTICILIVPFRVINAYHENTSSAATIVGVADAAECQLHANFNIIIKTKIE